MASKRDREETSHEGSAAEDMMEESTQEKHEIEKKRKKGDNADDGGSADSDDEDGEAEGSDDEDEQANMMAARVGEARTLHVSENEDDSEDDGEDTLEEHDSKNVDAGPNEAMEEDATLSNGNSRPTELTDSDGNLIGDGSNPVSLEARLRWETNAENKRYVQKLRELAKAKEMRNKQTDKREGNAPGTHRETLKKEEGITSLFFEKRAKRLQAKADAERLKNQEEQKALKELKKASMRERAEERAVEKARTLGNELMLMQIITSLMFPGTSDKVDVDEATVKGNTLYHYKDNPRNTETENRAEATAYFNEVKIIVQSTADDIQENTLELDSDDDDSEQWSDDEHASSEESYVDIDFEPDGDEEDNGQLGDIGDERMEEASEEEDGEVVGQAGGTADGDEQGGADEGDSEYAESAHDESQMKEDDEGSEGTSEPDNNLDSHLKDPDADESDADNAGVDQPDPANAGRDQTHPSNAGDEKTSPDEMEVVESEDQPLKEFEKLSNDALKDRIDVLLRNHWKNRDERSLITLSRVDEYQAYENEIQNRAVERLAGSSVLHEEDTSGTTLKRYESNFKRHLRMEKTNVPFLKNALKRMSKSLKRYIRLLDHLIRRHSLKNVTVYEINTMVDKMIEYLRGNKRNIHNIELYSDPRIFTAYEDGKSYMKMFDENADRVFVHDKVLRALYSDCKTSKAVFAKAQNSFVEIMAQSTLKKKRFKEVKLSFDKLITTFINSHITHLVPLAIQEELEESCDYKDVKLTWDVVYDEQLRMWRKKQKTMRAEKRLLLFSTLVELRANAPSEEAKRIAAGHLKQLESIHDTPDNPDLTYDHLVNEGDGHANENLSTAEATLDVEEVEGLMELTFGAGDAAIIRAWIANNIPLCEEVLKELNDSRHLPEEKKSKLSEDEEVELFFEYHEDKSDFHFSRYVTNEEMQVLRNDIDAKEKAKKEKNSMPRETAQKKLEDLYKEYLPAFSMKEFDSFIAKPSNEDGGKSVGAKKSETDSDEDEEMQESTETDGFHEKQAHVPASGNGGNSGGSSSTHAPSDPHTERQHDVTTLATPKQQETFSMGWTRKQINRATKLVRNDREKTALDKIFDAHPEIDARQKTREIDVFLGANRMRLPQILDQRSSLAYYTNEDANLKRDIQDSGTRLNDIEKFYEEESQFFSNKQKAAKKAAIMMCTAYRVESMQRLIIVREARVVKLRQRFDKRKDDLARAEEDTAGYLVGVWEDVKANWFDAYKFRTQVLAEDEDFYGCQVLLFQQVYTVFAKESDSAEKHRMLEQQKLDSLMNEQKEQAISIKKEFDIEFIKPPAELQDEIESMEKSIQDLAMKKQESLAHLQAFFDRIVTAEDLLTEHFNKRTTCHKNSMQVIENTSTDPDGSMHAINVLLDKAETKVTEFLINLQDSIEDLGDLKVRMRKFLKT